jgi:hypothetical protein
METQEERETGVYAVLFDGDSVLKNFLDVVTCMRKGTVDEGEETVVT